VIKITKKARRFDRILSCINYEEEREILMENNRSHRLIFRVDDEEFEFLKKKAELSNCKNMSSFLRKISLMGAIYNVDLSEFQEITVLLNSISRNINQIAILANKQKSIYKEDIEEMQARLDDMQKQFDKAFDTFSKMKGG
jgi:di/tripeptidase